MRGRGGVIRVLATAPVWVGMVVACATHQPAPARLEPGLAVATFDSAWLIIDRTYYDTLFNGVDWRALRGELRPRAMAAQDIHQLRAVLSDMVGRLHQSHFAIIPREQADAEGANDGVTVADQQGDLGFDLRLLDGQLLATRVDATGPAAMAGVRPGWIVQAIGGRPVQPWLDTLRAHTDPRPLGYRAWAAAHRRLTGNAGSTARITFRDGHDQSHTLSLVRRRAPGQVVKFGNLPPLVTRFEASRAQADGSSAGIIRFNYWMVPIQARIDSAVDAFRKLDGMVIDLRGNGGGVAAMLMGTAGHFLDEQIPFGTMRTRQTVLHFVANPRRVNRQGQRVQPFAGPLAVLIDELSASASEAFAGGMQAIGRARVFGTTSAGAMLPAAMDRLPDGDILYHAFADDVFPNGDRPEGRGVIPDVTVIPTRSDLLAGRDTVLAAALHWIATRPPAGAKRH